MPKSLQRVEEPDLFDYGKAVTLILSKTKELGKSHNAIVDSIILLEARKKQELSDLEHAIARKQELLQTQDQLVKKIMESKAAFQAEVDAKKQELSDREASLSVAEAAQAAEADKFATYQRETRNELELSAKGLQKEHQAALDRIKAREAAVDAREAEFKKTQTEYTETVATYESEKENLTDQRKVLMDLQEDLENKRIQLDNRETTITDKERALEEQRSKLATFASNLEGQSSLLQTERNKVQSDFNAIRDMQKTLHDKKLELDNREIHLRDRESIAASR
jgi:chromosome segregation ATPase